MKNTLIIGATGFLGMHILQEILQYNEQECVYCTVRGESLESAKEKFISSLQFYLGSEYIKLVGSKIKIILSDICEERFGLTKQEYEMLGNSVDRVIHCGALVKHFGKREEFFKVNVQGTERVIAFCKQYDCYMLFTSSIAVIGQAEGDNFLYKDLSKADVYVESKILAEKRMIECSKEGLRCSILRIGALSGRYSDGKFQKNISDSALYARLKVILRSGCFPNLLEEKKMEFLPVDICSRIICKIASKEIEGDYLIYNRNTISGRELVDICMDLGYSVQLKSYSSFNEYLNHMKLYKLQRDVLTGFYLQMKRKNSKKLSSEKTEALLVALNEEWPKIDKAYLKKVIDYMLECHYI